MYPFLHWLQNLDVHGLMQCLCAVLDKKATSKVRIFIIIDSHFSVEHMKNLQQSRKKNTFFGISVWKHSCYLSLEEISAWVTFLFCFLCHSYAGWKHKHYKWGTSIRTRDLKTNNPTSAGSKVLSWNRRTPQEHGDSSGIWSRYRLTLAVELKNCVVVQFQTKSIPVPPLRLAHTCRLVARN